MQDKTIDMIKTSLTAGISALDISALNIKLRGGVVGQKHIEIKKLHQDAINFIDEYKKKDREGELLLRAGLYMIINQMRIVASQPDKLI